jgi:phosphoglycolate phosphatase
MRLVLLDCDGTLVDSQQAIVSAMTAAWQAAGLRIPDPQAVRRVVSLPLTEAIAVLLPGGEDWFIKRLAGLYRDAFYRERHHERPESEPLYPGVHEALTAMRASGLGLGIATGKSFKGLVTVLEQHRLIDFFATLQTADRGLGKPNPDMVFRAQEETCSALADIVVVGDSTFDMEMACRAGVRAVGVAWGYHSVDELEAAGACRIVHRWDELPQAVLDVMDGHR